MPEFQIPMNDVPNEYTRLDEHLIYLTRISNVEIRKSGSESKTPGEPYILVSLEVRRPEDWEGKTMTELINLPQIPTPLDSVAERRRKLERGVRLRQFMEAHELKWGPTGFKTEDWVGAEAGCTVRNEEGKSGDVFSKPKKWMPASAVRQVLDAQAQASPDGNSPTPVTSDQGI